MDQSVKVQLDQEETSAKAGRGVRKGCCLSPIIFKVYNDKLTKEAVCGFQDFKIGQVILTVKYADDPVLLAKEEMVLQGLIDGLIEIRRCHGVEISVEKINVMRISRLSSPNADDRNNQRLWNVSTVWVA